MPQLPRYKDLVSDLSPIHARLSCENALAKKHPMYKCNEVQVLIFVYYVECGSILFGSHYFFIEKKVLPPDPVHVQQICLYSMFVVFKVKMVLVWLILQAKASCQFLNVLRTYLESLCSELRYHTITNVQSDNDRVRIIQFCLHFTS